MADKIFLVRASNGETFALKHEDGKFELATIPKDKVNVATQQINDYLVDNYIPDNDDDYNLAMETDLHYKTLVSMEFDISGVSKEKPKGSQDLINVLSSLDNYKKFEN